MSIYTDTEPLTPEEEKGYILRCHNGDKEAREKLILSNVKLVTHLAKRYRNSNIPFEDLLSIGKIGLIKGVDTFNPSKGVRLSAYIGMCIINEILMALRKSKKQLQELSLYNIISVDKSGNTQTIEDILEDDGPSIEEQAEVSYSIKQIRELCNSILTDRERAVIYLHYGMSGKEPMKQIEIAREIGISVTRVRRLLMKTTEKLRDEMNGGECYEGDSTRRSSYQ